MNGPVWMVTGAAGGIGTATIRRLAEKPAIIVGVDLREPADDLPIDMFFPADLTKDGEVARIVEQTLSELGRVDSLINCTGMAPRTQIPDIDEAEWDLVMNVNLKSVFFLCRAVLEPMKKAGRGAIVNLASAAGKLGGVTVGAHYSASKAGIMCLTKSLAHYGAPFGIRANAVCPGPTETRMIADWDEETNKRFKTKIPLGRYAKPEEVADTIAFLLSPGAAYITGEIIDVNGGLLMD